MSFSGELERLPPLDAGHVAHDGGGPAIIPQADFGYAIGVFLVAEDDALKHSGDGLLVLRVCLHLDSTMANRAGGKVNTGLRSGELECIASRVYALIFTDYFL